jgi:hypothetical protein
MELSRRLERADAKTFAMLPETFGADGEGVGVAGRAFGMGYALSIASMKWTLMNRAVGLTEPGEVSASARWFEERGVPARIDFPPHSVTGGILEALRKARMVQQLELSASRRIVYR